MPTDRVEFLGLPFDPVTQREVLERLAGVTAESPYRYVVTPNVDHVLQVHEASDRSVLEEVYRLSWLSVCDSQILRRLARFHSIDLPLVTGSDLTVAVLSKVVRPRDRVAVVGGSGDLLADLRRLYPHLDWVHYTPPMGLRSNAEARTQTARFIASAKARFTFIAVGSLQQELIAAEVHDFPGATGTALCIGAALEFITGRQRRAPRPFQRMGLEWAYRLASNPGRLWRRYLRRGPQIFLLAARHGRQRGRA